MVHVCFEQHHQRRRPREAPAVRFARQVRTFVEWRTRRLSSSTCVVLARGRVLVGFDVRTIAQDLPVAIGYIRQRSSRATLQSATVDASFDALHGVRETILRRGHGRARVQQVHACGCHEEACSDTPTRRSTGQMLSTSPSNATPTPDAGDVSSARPHYVAAAAAPGGMRDPLGCPPVSFMESAFEMIDCGSPHFAGH